MGKHKNPLPTVDVIIEVVRPDGKPGIVLIKRKYPPPGWALPGGFVEYGESLEEAAVREAKEETSLDIELIRQLHTYSAADRDPRFHTITTVYLARAEGRPRARDDAAEIGVFTEADRPRPLAFDHEQILADHYRDKKKRKQLEWSVMPEERDPKKDRDMELKEVCRIMGPVELEVIKSFLESHGIACVTRGTWVQSISPISVNGLGEIRILVAEKDYEVAKELLENRPVPEEE